VKSTEVSEVREVLVIHKIFRTNRSLNLPMMHGLDNKHRVFLWYSIVRRQMDTQLSGSLW
jgi:hypothetical protein